MAENELKPESQETPELIVEKKPSLINPKIFLFGLPLFIAQLLAVYFITANILMSKIHGSEKPDSLKTENKGVVNQQKDVKPTVVEVGKFIYSIDDIIVNPAETDGKRLLLTSIGFDLQTEDEKKEMQSKEIIIKDIVITTLSSKSFDKLSNFAYRDTLKLEISNKLKTTIPKVKLDKVYFSKFIIQ